MHWLNIYKMLAIITQVFILMGELQTQSLASYTYCQVHSKPGIFLNTKAVHTPLANCHLYHRQPTLPTN